MTPFSLLAQAFSSMLRLADDAVKLACCGWSLLKISTCAQVPEGIDSRAVIDHAMRTYDLEIATGLPPIGGSAWRIGLLGYNANAANVALVVQAFREGLAAQGFC